MLTNREFLFYLLNSDIKNPWTERAQSLARAVSGEALPIEQLNTYCPENGMILANCSAIGMEPDVHLTPVSKVPYLPNLSICVCMN